MKKLITTIICLLISSSIVYAGEKQKIVPLRCDFEASSNVLKFAKENFVDKNRGQGWMMGKDIGVFEPVIESRKYLSNQYYRYVIRVEVSPFAEADHTETIEKISLKYIVDYGLQHDSRTKTDTCARSGSVRFL